MRRRLARPLLLSAALAVTYVAAAGCATTATYVAPDRRAEPAPALPDGPAHVVYLVGNTGDVGGADPVVLRALAEQARADGEDATVVVLGDVTAAGLPDEDDPGRAEAEAPVRALIGALGGLEAEVVVVPGDRDWALGEDGLKRLEDFLEAGFDADVLTPGDQSGGPREDKLAEGLRLIALDTGWWLLDPEDRPDGEAEDQDVRSLGDVARIFDQIVADRDDDRIVVVAHHPILSRGPRGGYVGNPLTGLVSRTVGFGRQDLASTRYRGLRAALGRTAREHDRLVWAAAHDRILQVETEVVNPLLAQTHVIAGTAGGDGDPFGVGSALYLSAAPGYQRLVYYPDGRLWAETVEVDEAGRAEVVFRSEVADPVEELVADRVPDDVDPAALPETSGTVTLAPDEDFAGDRFQNDGLSRALLGERYRDVWKTPVEFPVLDMGTFAGGLTPVKRGGGKQTTGLRLEGADGHEYGLRLLEKSGLAQVPGELRDGLVGDLVLELRAAMLPYAELVAAPLAEAAGVPHATTQIVFVPDDPRLGRYRATFGNRLASIRIRPDDDMSDVPGFEGYADVVSAADLREELREDQDHRVDQRALLRARLLDMVLADWDRHYDQWRWGAFEPGELDPSLEGDEATRGKVYRPIPRDRDFALYGIGGLFAPAAQRFDNRLQGIGEDYDSVVGLTTNGFFQDRRFLNELTREDWQAVAEELQTRLTDDAIDRALGELPGPVYDQVAGDLRTALRGRRDRLPEVAATYYEIHAGVVDVLGSDERELFEAVRQPDGALDVTVRSFKGGEPGAVLYRRTFRRDDTREVRLYALGGRDEVRVTGDGPRAVAVRVIGGAGDDTVDASGGDVALYDTPDGAEVTAEGRAFEDRRSDQADVNRYDETEMVLADTDTYPLVGFRPTDGVIVGLNRLWYVPGFRLKPYAAVHSLSVNVATGSGGVAAGYSGFMREAVGTYSLSVRAGGSTPVYARNFYGLGNGSADVDPDLARVDLATLNGRVGLGVPLGQDLRLDVGPVARFADASVPVEPGAPARDLAALDPVAFNAQTHVGAFFEVGAAALDRAPNPRSGLRAGLFGEALAGVQGPAETYGRVGGEVVAYVPVRLQPQLTLAVRAGGEHLFGDFPFFDAAVLGGLGTLRGYRRERFAGRTAVSGSVEARAKLFDLDVYVLPLDVGALAFADAGRVWADTPTCEDVSADPVSCNLRDGQLRPPIPDPDGAQGLQLGYGGGLWFGALDRAVATLAVGASDEEVLVTFGLGFAY